MRLFAALAAALLLIAAAVPAQAEERIRDFVSDVTVSPDAVVSVQETITVLAEGREIRHGILRDVPTSYAIDTGERLTVGFDVTEVTLDGEPAPFTIEALANGQRIRIGRADRLLEPGLHSYRISYRTTRQVGFFADHDELYWNVTGNGWTLPIDHARVLIRLPEGAGINQHAEYTGFQGEAGSAVRVFRASGNLFSAETTARLEARAGFTVAVGWQKGIVTPPGPRQQWLWWISDNAGFFVLGLGLAAALGYFLFAWNLVGRDPARGTIIPLFRPPQGLSPAAVRYVSRYGADDKGFAAALVGLAVKGRLKIDDEDDGYAITRLAPSGPWERLTPAEEALHGAIPPGTTALTQRNHQQVKAMKDALDRALGREHDGKAFLRNLGWFAGGLGLSVAFLLGGALLLPEGDGRTGLFAVAATALWWGVVLSVGWASIRRGFAAQGLWGRLSSLAGLLVLIPFAGAGVMAPAMILLSGDGSPALYVLVAAAALMGLLNVVFYHLLRAPTASGRRLMDEIEGFRLYLSTAEEERLNLLNPPDETPELFERYLPYALALDCENEWNARFAAVLAAAAAAHAAGPVWYSGRHWGRGWHEGFGESLGRGLAASTAAASVAPGRSSGSGGGGFSGGGGGGGGGSGW